MKKNVYLFEINDILTNQAKLPYSTGLIWSYCKTIESISNNFNLDKLFWWRRETGVILEQIEAPYIVGFSCFVWNWNNNIELAKKIKEKYPNCIIVFGGWQAPMSDRSKGFFHKYPFVDIIAHGEGEIIFSNILLESLKETPDWSSVSGCSIPYKMVLDKSEPNIIIDYGLKIISENKPENPDDYDTFVTLPQERISDLASMPSPYLDGLFDELVKDCKYDLEATIETTRGCPYSCTYCEIGTKYYQKIKTHKLDKIYAEIDWLSENRVVFVYNADSNFGMLKDHLQVTEYLVKKKQETGYPQKHRCDWSKNQADKVIKLAKIFYDARMDKGITIALQSMNPGTLKAIKRKNVDGGKLKEFLKLYGDEDLPSYVELILGLPEETKQSFIDGICKVIELGQHNYIGIYALTALPNTPFGDQKYLDKHGLKIIDTYPAFSHIDISEINNFEREHMVVSSNTMTIDDYKECTIHRWMFMFGHYLGTTQFISRFLNNHLDISYSYFYMELMKFMKSMNNSGFLGTQLMKTKESLDLVMKAQAPWGRVVKSVRDKFAWDFEEATVIDIMKNKEIFFNEMKHFLALHFNIEENVVKDLIKYQNFAILDPQKTYPLVENFTYNIHDVIYNGSELSIRPTSLSFEGKNYNGNFFDYGKETLWWGRRVAAYKNKIMENGVLGAK
tara:strand:- start:1782 stop:3806 length:2025 start_codon:yes stop_codon:yes gene_type:complete